MTRQGARVVIIGAGAAGLACAQQLARTGIRDVVVIDQNPAAGQGSTGRANGGVRAQFSTATNIAFSRYTIRELAALDRRSGGMVGYRPFGYLFLAGTDASAGRLERDVALQRELGVDVEVLSAQRVAELAPCVSLGGLLLASYCGDDGVIDPHGVAAAMCGEAAGLGVRFQFGATVRGMTVHTDHISVECDPESVDCDLVVNAAGPHAREVAAMAGLDLPVLPHRHNLACTEAMPGIPRSLPMCVDMDTGVHIRREGAGVLIGCAVPGAATFDTTFDPAFLEVVGTRIGGRFPSLAEAAVNPRKCWAGLYPETPDHSAVVDAPQDLPWFIQCAGFGGHGIMHSLAAGLCVAELVRDQRCTTFDISSLSLTRFTTAPSDVETAIL
ncbi:MAG: FAD-binding oxidoreductase [Candidatus Dormibacteraeota bacterium]|nr:FAD-binding oxidoreductase [Candidatus Dormibacteraeota bacterium]